MKKNSNFRLLCGLLTAIAPLACSAQTTFFSDNFNNGSTTNGISIPGGTPTASFTSYDIASTKAALTNGITPGQFRLALNSPTTSGFVEAQALFTTNPISLNVVGDYIDLAVVFTNTTGTVLAGGSSSALWLGLFNSEAAPGTTNPPVPFAALSSSGLTTATGSPYATGNCADWLGYVGQISGGSRIITRPQQTGALTDSANQDLLGNNVGSGAFDNPAGTAITPLGTNATAPPALTSGATYTLDFRITLSSQNILSVSNALYQGNSTGGTVLFSMVTTNASGANFLVTTFDGIGIGIRNSGTSMNPLMDISSVLITGQSTIPTGPPTITAEPTNTLVTTNGSCAFFVTALGDSVTYQWYRNGTQKLVDSGNISGATSSTLVVSPAGTADQFTGALNGYYCVVKGAGNFSTNSTTNTLTLITSTNLIWTDVDSGNTWDINNTIDWQDTNGNPSVFNYGDPVTFDDTSGGGFVNLVGSYLAASSVTVNSTLLYTIQGSGSIAGPGPLDYIGSGRLVLNAANTYSGGTLVSNANAYVYLENYAGLGAGPVTLGKAGGRIEVVPSGSATSGIQGVINVADDFTILVDPTNNSFAGVFLNDLAGTVGKTLTISNGTTAIGGFYRIRAYGQNTVYNANINLADNAILFATYASSGSQTYNGVISGAGSLMQKGTLTTLNAQNTYSGGTTPAQGAIGLGVSSVGSPGSLSSGPIGTGPLLLVPDSTTSLTANGLLLASVNNITIGNAIQYPSGTNNLTLDVGGTNNITFSGPFTLQGNDGIKTNTFASRTVQVTNTALTAFTGVISDGGLVYGLNLTGNGTLALNNNETYTGPTTNSGGTLLVNGQLPSSSVIVATNGMLGGTGTISGPVTVQQGGGISAGSSQSIGTLTINNSLTLLGGSTNRVKVNKGASTQDLVAVSGSVAYNGTLFATNLSGTITMSDTFHVFSAGSESGTFTNVIGTPGPGLAWSFNPATGILSVVQGVNTNPTNITFSVSGGNLNLSWPADHLGWSLEVETNSLAKGISSNWVRVANSSNITSTNFPVVTTNATVFYRLIYP